MNNEHLVPLVTASVFEQHQHEMENDGTTTYPVALYEPKGGGTLFRFIALMLGAAMLGLLVDFVFSIFFGTATQFLVVFAGVFGCLMGYSIGMIARLLRLRSGKDSYVVVAIAAFCGLYTYSNLHYAYYLREIDPDRGSNETFLQFLDRRATKGYEFPTRGGDPINFGYAGTWIYWLIELGIATGLTAFYAYSTTRSPFCEICDRWCRRRRFGPFPFDVCEGHKAFLAGRPESLFVPGPRDHKITLVIYDCPTCQQSPLAIQFRGKIGSGNKSPLRDAFLVYPHAALPVFEEAEYLLKQLGKPSSTK